jgi:hypothetical protein
MQRAIHVGQAVRRRASELPLTWVDVVLMVTGTLGALIILLTAHWVPGSAEAFVAFCAIAVGPPVLRGLAARFKRFRLLDTAASFWLLPSSVLGHNYLGPVVDALNPRLLDGYLAQMDLILFGMHPAEVLSRSLPGPLIDLLLVCYYGHFLWPFVLGVLLYRAGRREAYFEYTLAMALFFLANFALYVAVPAIGPRYFLANEMGGPLQGWVLTPFLDGLMRDPVFTRDCFPSGHTGIGLLVLSYAYRYHPKFFWLALPMISGLIAGTLVGRFHYGIDLVAAAPLAFATASTAALMTRARPQGIRVPVVVPEAWRASLKI